MCNGQQGIDQQNTDLKRISHTLQFHPVVGIWQSKSVLASVQNEENTTITNYYNAQTKCCRRQNYGTNERTQFFSMSIWH